jgi:hypothetical protein
MKTSTRRIAILAGGLLTLAAAGLAIGDYDDDHGDDHDEGRGHGGWIEPGKDVLPVTNPTYADECGACHMPYQPGLLPAADWQRIMETDALADHYGDDASLAAAVRDEIAAYLDANSADQARGSRSRAFAKGGSVTDGLPRITEKRYFLSEHHEIPQRMVVDNAGVGSFSNCNACHQGAADGVYNEHRVRIPGFGRWDD